MAGEIRDASGRRFEQLNLSRTRLHGAFLVDTKVTNAWVHSLDLSGEIQSLVVMSEEWWHHRYADRDLAVLAGRSGT